VREQEKKGLVLAGLLVGMLVAALDQTIVDTAFPRMIAELHGEDQFTWVITAYLLASTAVVPVVGKLADIYGRKIFYLIGMGLFVGSSMLCGAAESMLQLILFRALQGIGGGMVMPVVFTIVGDLFPGEARARMQGLFGGVFGVASVLGPKLGGWITHHFSWRWIFYINLPLGLIAMAFMFLFYRESRGERRPVGWLGALTVMASVVLFLLAMAQGGEAWAWDSWQSITLFGGSALFLILFLAVERRVPEPVLDPSLFRNRTFAVMQAVGLLMGAGMFMAVIFIPWFIQGVVGYNPNQAGNVMTPMMLSMVVASVLGGRAALRFTYRQQLSAGFLILLAGFFTMTRWTPHTTALQATVSSMILGAGLGLIMPITTLAVQNAFPAHRRGVVTSATAFFRQNGGTVGSTLGGAIFNHQMAARFQERLAGQVARLQEAGAALPPQAAAFFREAAADPQMLVRLLLSSEAQAAIPAAFREPLLAGVKAMMVDSLHVVFYTGIALVFAGLVAVQLLGSVSLREQTRTAQAGAAGDAPKLGAPPAVH